MPLLQTNPAKRLWEIRHRPATSKAATVFHIPALSAYEPWAPAASVQITRSSVPLTLQTSSVVSPRPKTFNPPPFTQREYRHLISFTIGATTIVGNPTTWPAANHSVATRASVRDLSQRLTTELATPPPLPEAYGNDNPTAGSSQHDRKQVNKDGLRQPGYPPQGGTEYNPYDSRDPGKE